MHCIYVKQVVELILEFTNSRFGQDGAQSLLLKIRLTEINHKTVQH